MKYRLWNKFRAAIGGYFWLPCPLCGQFFGGHEWRDIDDKPSHIPSDRPGIYQGICPDCTLSGYGQQHRFYFDNQSLKSDVAEKRGTF